MVDLRDETSWSLEYTKNTTHSLTASTQFLRVYRVRLRGACVGEGEQEQGQGRSRGERERGDPILRRSNPPKNGTADLVTSR